MRMGEIHFGKVAIHTLAAYPPANLNRDEDGRPKTAIVGGDGASQGVVTGTEAALATI